MSNLLDFLKSILNVFISKFPDFVKGLVNKIPAKIKKEVGVIISVVNGVKSFVDSPLADVITTIIPGTVDDKVKQWLRVWLPVVLTDLNVLNDGVIRFSEDSEVRGAQLRGIASALTQKYTGMPGDQAAITSAVVYKAAA